MLFWEKLVTIRPQRVNIELTHLQLQCDTAFTMLPIGAYCNEELIVVGNDVSGLCT
jgi:hypothetical protein